MSLTAEDSEGEQNEMRSLQTQLDLTTQLVHKLSLQLTELKEQVGIPFLVFLVTPVQFFVPNF